jgi:hypothetical protein
MKKNDSNLMELKELGSLQQKIVFYIAENPESHKQEIQQGINHPAEQYGSIVKGVKVLEKLKYIQSDEGISQKNVKIKLYSCTNLGVFYSLAKNNIADIKKILRSNKNRVKFCEPLMEFYELIGHDYFSIYFKDAADVLPIVQREGFEAALPYLLMKAIKNEQIIDPEIRDKNAKIALKVSPETRVIFDDLRKKLNEILDNP